MLAPAIGFELKESRATAGAGLVHGGLGEPEDVLHRIAVRLMRLDPVADGADDRAAAAVEIALAVRVLDPDPFGADRDGVGESQVAREEMRGEEKCPISALPKYLSMRTSVRFRRPSRR